MPKKETTRTLSSKEPGCQGKNARFEGFFAFHLLDLHVRCLEKVTQTYSPKWWFFHGDESYGGSRKKSPTKRIQAVEV